MKCKSGCTMNKLHAGALGAACGILKGVFLMLLAATSGYWVMGSKLVALIGQILPRYTPTLSGVLYGGIHGLITGFIFGFLLALLYNICVCCCHCCKSRCEKSSV